MEKKNANTTQARGLFFRPVRADEIDVRVQSINSYKATVLLYKDARVDQNILDETVGCFNWKREHSRDNANCTVSLWDAEKSQWVSKEDTGVESNTEKEKGLASDSFKRACFNWGIGRELYTTPLVQIPTEFINIKELNGRKTTYDKFFVQDIEVTVDENTGAKRITKLTIGIEHNNQRDWVWSWGGGTEIRTHKPAWVSGNNGSANAQNNAPQQNAPAQQGGWGNNAPAPSGQKGSFGRSNSSGNTGGSNGGWGNKNNGNSNRSWGNAS